MDRKSLIGAGRNELTHYQSSSHYGRDPWKLHPSQPSLGPGSRGRAMQAPLPMMGHKLASPYHKGQGFDVDYFEMDALSAASSSEATENRQAKRARSPHPTPSAWSQIPKPLPPIGVQQKQLRSRFDSVDGGGTQVSDSNTQNFSHSQNIKSFYFIVLPPMPYLYSGLISLNQQRHKRATLMGAQSQEIHEKVSPPPQLLHSDIITFICPTSDSSPSQGQRALNSMLPKSSLGISPSHAIRAVVNSSAYIHGSGLPPLPPGAPPVSLDVGGISRAGSIMPNAPTLPISGLITSLVAQGLISLPPATSSEVLVCEFLISFYFQIYFAASSLIVFNQASWFYRTQLALSSMWIFLKFGMSLQ